jgi:hypothetical protein
MRILICSIGHFNNLVHYHQKGTDCTGHEGCDGTVMQRQVALDSLELPNVPFDIFEGTESDRAHNTDAHERDEGSLVEAHEALIFHDLGDAVDDAIVFFFGPLGLKHDFDFFEGLHDDDLGPAGNHPIKEIRKSHKQ